MRYQLQNLLPDLLDAVPELRDGYEAVRSEYVAAAPFLSQQDHEELQEIYRINDIPEVSFEEPGITLLFEGLLVPFIVGLSSEVSRSQRLREVMDWLEGLANSQIPDVRNLVASGVCESLITTNQKHLAEIYPYMGEGMRELCRMQLDMYHVSDHTMNLLKK